MKKIFLPVLLLFSCRVAWAMETSGGTPDYKPAAHRLVWIVRKEMWRHGVVGLSIAVVDDQKIAWARGFGHADKHKDVTATPETVYRVGSISKLFTATAAVRLAERGLMDLDRPLRDYLPEFSIRSRFDGGAITPHNIMTHHSGLPANYLRGMWTSDPAPLALLVELTAGDHAVSAPNTVFSYSNLGFALLGAAVEKTVGRDFSAHMEETLLGPLGMTSSGFSARPGTAPGSSKGYRDGREADDPPLRDVPAGGLNSSVADLARFIEMIFADGRCGDKTILAHGSVGEMLRPQNEDVPLDFSFRVGLGWMLSGLGDIDIKGAGPVAHHAGATPLFHGQLIILPKHKLGVVVLANTDSSREAVDKIATEAVKLALEAKTGIKPPKPEKAPSTTSSFPPDVAAEYDGGYSTVIGFARITRRDGGLRAEAAGRTFRLVNRSDGRLAIRYRWLGFIPIPLGILNDVGLSLVKTGGRDFLTARLGGVEILAGTKMRPAKTPEKWSGRLGDYEILNADGDAPELLPKEVKLVEDDGFLVVEYSTPLTKKAVIRRALLPLSDEEALIPGPAGEGTGETVTVETSGGGEVFRYSGYLFGKKGAR